MTHLPTILYCIEIAALLIAFAAAFYAVRLKRELYGFLSSYAKALSLSLDAIEELSRGQEYLREASNRITGLLQKTTIDAKVTEKIAERAYSLSGSANLGVAILQKSLSVKKPAVSAEQNARNKLILTQLAKEEDEMIDWMEPTLNDEEREILEDVRKRVNGKVTQ